MNKSSLFALALLVCIPACCCRKKKAVVKTETVETTEQVASAEAPETKQPQTTKF